MKTVITTLPIYKALKDQYYQRSISNGSPSIAPVITPLHRLPSFQWIDGDDGATTVTKIELIDEDGSSEDITTYFPTLPSSVAITGDIYFFYNGDTLNYALPTGLHYLKITMDSGHEYYSDWIRATCVYQKFAKSFTNVSFDTFTIADTTISSCVDAGAGAYADSSPRRSVYKGQQITVIFYLTETGATNPDISVVSASQGVISNVAATTAGLNELTLTVTSPADDAFIRISAAGATNFETSEILVYEQYSEKYVTLSFSNCCNIGDLQYENDFYQTLWIDSDNIEPQFPYTEKGQEDGNGKFIPTFRRQEKTYLIRTGNISQYMVDVLHRLKMHDAITFIDKVGDAFKVESIEVDHEWPYPDKYYAVASITISLGEDVTAAACCDII